MFGFKRMLRKVPQIDQFGEQFILEIQIDVPRIEFSGSLTRELYDKINQLHFDSYVAWTSFRPGLYQIGRDGSMHTIDTINEGQSKMPRVAIEIDLMEMPAPIRIGTLLQAVPSNALERSDNLVLIGVHGHGSIRIGEGEARHVMLRFAVRDGEVIVADIT